MPGIHYSNIYTWTDEVVTPNTPPNASSALIEADGVANIALQDVCPNNVADHLAIGSYDAVAAALAFDALDHPGPADPSRIAATVCLQPFMEGVDAASFSDDYAAMVAFIGETSAQTENVAEVGMERFQQMRERVARDINTTFASHYTQEISLAEMMQPEIIRGYAKQATGEKYLVNPQK